MLIPPHPPPRSLYFFHLVLQADTLSTPFSWRRFLSLAFHWSVTLPWSWLYGGAQFQLLILGGPKALPPFPYLPPPSCIHLLKYILSLTNISTYPERSAASSNHLPFCLLLPLRFSLGSYDLRYTFEKIFLSFNSMSMCFVAERYTYKI